MDISQKPPGDAGASGAPASRLSRATLEPWVPQSLADREAILAQLELLLVHPLFFQSKRYPALLRFVVEQTLDGNADQVKERSIGMEVFGRPPGYDANADPVVRVTAGEIRKRLAQYYYDPSHADEIRIELPTGSYVPVFQRTIETVEPPVALPAPPSVPQSLPEPVQPQPPTGAELPQITQSQPIVHHVAHPLLTLLLVFVTLLLGLAGGYWYRQYRQSRIPVPVPADQSVDDFWQPMTAGPATVTFCLGEPARDSSGDTDPAQTIKHPKLAEPLYFRLRQSGLFALADVVTLTRMTDVLERQKKSFRVSAASEASFSQLREGPAVLIGAFDNLWTMRLTRDLRFGFDSIDGNAFIVDRRSSTKTTWFTAWDLPYEKLARDYAIVARYRDSLTGQPVVIAAGISEEGTEAAGELISNAADLNALLQKAPSNWRNMNMEAVIETQVIDGHSGPPRVRAVEFW
ncbi:hypothetical protein [Acidicapsa acidisoli]|uniref:hypothetical protein n=1 Tax=Acidicapsa acidisoli TaxID=1615681 RepID=UPI0021E0AD62|nr:hypothetical protein [Acidicapsa acidisoli]